ncbi:MAG: hypothetical protein ACFFG0_09175 [Candidatus Thorarchaeota archaeon]
MLAILAGTFYGAKGLEVDVIKIHDLNKHISNQDEINKILPYIIKYINVKLNQ